jgi:phage tail sheath protein FI
MDEERVAQGAHANAATREYLASLEAALERVLDRGAWSLTPGEADEGVWQAADRAVEEFLLAEWHRGTLAGERPQEAYFVRCDRSTMTQEDIDRGRLVVLVGVAPLRASEFVLLQIGRWLGGGCSTA